MHAREQRRRSGFTLVEIVVALGLFVMGMVTLQAMQLHAMRAGSGGRHATQAGAIAESQMEQLQRRSWNQIAPTAGWTPPVAVANTVQGNPDLDEQTYNLDWRITDLVAGWTRTIDVRVQWSDRNRPNRSVSFSSIRFNREGI